MAKAAHSTFRFRKNRSRPVIAVALVVLVGAGGAWLMFSESGDGVAADESIPWSTMTDDRYVSDESVDYTPKPRRTPTRSPSESPGETPSETPSETATPTETVPPTADPTDEPTDDPTSIPTSSSTSDPTSDPRPTTRPTSTGRPTQSTSPRPTKSTPTTPPWNDGGDMNGDEQALFDMIDSARTDKGCSPLLPDSGLSEQSRSSAGRMAEDRQYSGGGKQAAAGGGGSVSPSSAYDQMMSSYGGILLDCGLDRLGVGKAEDQDCIIGLLGCIGKSTTTGWAATFAYR
jgi:uncharacterized protein YkwD